MSKIHRLREGNSVVLTHYVMKQFSNHEIISKGWELLPNGSVRMPVSDAKGIDKHPVVSKYKQLRRFSRTV